MLKHAKGQGDYINYITFLFVNEQPAEVVGLTPENYHLARSAAAILLKNDIKLGYKKIAPEYKTYLKSVILQGLRDNNGQIRNYAGNVITEIVRQGGIMDWPQILAELVAMVQNKSGSDSAAAQEGAASALLKICEDNKKALDKTYQGEKPLAFLIPQFLAFTNSELPKVRSSALASINVFLPDQPQSIVDHLDAIMQNLSRLAQDSSEEVRKQVCRSFVHIAEISPERIGPHMGELVDYMVTQQRSQDDPELALDAAEFWLCVAENHDLREVLQPYLPKVVPVLMESMVYSEDDIIRLEGEAEDAELEDKESDIKPAFATAKAGRLTSGALNGEMPGAGANGAAKANSLAIDDDDDLSEGEVPEDDDEDDDAYDDPEEQWNLRKCSAAALDVLASVFHQPVFEVTLPYLKDNLNHPEWPNREAAVLALGAIADGCLEVVTPSLPELTTYLISLLQDKEPVVRQITCWSLGRYSAWAAHLDAAGKRQYFEPIMDGILKRMLDPNKRVQEAAASAFANLEEKANKQLSEYCPVIVRQFVECFGKYKDRNIFILYDCVQTLAEHVGPALADPALVQMLMPALLQRWNKVNDQSREMFPLLECLSYVATALGDTFAPYAQAIFIRCINIIHQNLEISLQADTNPDVDKPEQDFLVTSLDLLSAIIQALDPAKSAELVAGSKPNLFELLVYCMRDSSGDVRQSAYALLGDCAIYVFAQLQTALPSILPILIEQMDISKVDESITDSGYSVVNNACWSLGEIAMREKQGMTPYIDQLLSRLGGILFNNKVPESLIENAAIALGRLGIGCAELIAPHLATIAVPFLSAMRHIQVTDEKGHALRGFSEIVLRNPQAMSQGLLDYLQEIAAWEQVTHSPGEEDPVESFQKVRSTSALVISDANVMTGLATV